MIGRPAYRAAELLLLGLAVIVSGEERLKTLRASEQQTLRASEALSAENAPCPVRPWCKPTGQANFCCKNEDCCSDACQQDIFAGLSTCVGVNKFVPDSVASYQGLFCRKEPPSSTPTPSPTRLSQSNSPSRTPSKFPSPPPSSEALCPLRENCILTGAAKSYSTSCSQNSACCSDLCNTWYGANTCVGDHKYVPSKTLNAQGVWTEQKSICVKSSPSPQPLKGPPGQAFCPLRQGCKKSPGSDCFHSSECCSDACTGGGWPKKCTGEHKYVPSQTIDKERAWVEQWSICRTSW